ncbi:fructose-1-phosphate kinase PfkB-like protein [Microbacterium sp. W4I4]|uniref:1-phosphofructokinase family hexose kinase n=1 Tax=Microbacterium sp. W4I4 TaxID=3042295 RepID=UPI0027827D75|nr:PfkB family carbohydrate kinase [Microbacterium sp. W4I4]MDQ0614546.1 fructose-1-phosphate kinase PfkB-like protein [Microbacterium sp. W4I4]
MIITVTPNPALDLTWHVASLAVGSTHRADAGVARAGGKGLNVARVAHAQGASALAVTTAGGETGEEFAAELGASGVPHVLVPVAASTRRSIALVDEALGDTTVVNEYGIAPTAVEWTALTDAVTAALTAASREKPHSAQETTSAQVSHAGSGFSRADAGASDVLVISGSFPPGTPDDLLPALIRLGRDAGASVIVDTSGPSLLVAADAGASVLKPNEHELRDATGLDDPITGAQELLRRGAELVLLSLGAEGMLAVSLSADDGTGADTPHVGRIPASGPTSGVSAPEMDAVTAGTGPDAVTAVPERDAVTAVPERDAARAATAVGALSILHARLDTPLAGNPTGAGDAAVAACAVLMDAGIRDPEQILRRATAWSAAAVLMPLAGERSTSPGPTSSTPSPSGPGPRRHLLHET